MLKDPIEIEIISKAKQKNVRDPKRSREHFHRIFTDFFDKVEFSGKTFLDLGPGQYDFAELARAKGAETHGIDKDPAVVELGQYKKLPIREGQIKEIKAEDFAPLKFDGLFCKLSLNAFWFLNPQQHVAFIHELSKLTKENAWGWIAPWNGIPPNQRLSVGEINAILEIQIETFKKRGFEYVELTEKASKYYGVHGITANRPLFYKNLPVSSKLIRL